MLLFPFTLAATPVEQAHHFQYSEQVLQRALSPALELECYLQTHPEATYAELAAQPETAPLVEGLAAQPRIQEEDRGFDFLAFFVGVSIGCLASLAILFLSIPQGGCL